MTQDRVWTGNYLKIWIGNFLIYFSFMLIVPLLPLYLNETFGADKETIGFALAGYTVMALAIRPFSGYLVDSYPRKAVLMVCYFLFAALFGGYLIAGSLTMFTIFRTLHGAPFGATTVAANTVAIDVLSPGCRAEGIGYYGLSNNLANVLGPVAAIYVLQAFDGNFKALLWLSLVISFIGLVVDSTIKLPRRDFVPEKKVLSLDRFFLLKGWPEAISMACFAFSYGVISTYVAIYGKEELGMEEGTGLFFTFLAIGLILSRLTGAKGLKHNRVSHNASVGICISLCGYCLFAALHNPIGYYLAPFVIGLGNGHMYPALQTMFINLAEHNKRGTANSSTLTAWDAGVGLGILAGGLAAERVGYHCAFWVAFAINAAGVAHYFLQTRSHFERNKLR
ncbi:MAG: MFS transporter [Bacteroidales bacterium]|nr:MFS transporter [Candidatus Cacconaster merdequi]